MRGCALVAVIEIALRAVIVGAVAAAVAVGIGMRRGEKSCQGLADRLLATLFETALPKSTANNEKPKLLARLVAPLLYVAPPSATFPDVAALAVMLALKTDTPPR